MHVLVCLQVNAMEVQILDSTAVPIGPINGVIVKKKKDRQGETVKKVTNKQFSIRIEDSRLIC